MGNQIYPKLCADRRTFEHVITRCLEQNCIAAKNNVTFNHGSEATGGGKLSLSMAGRECGWDTTWVCLLLCKELCARVCLFCTLFRPTLSVSPSLVVFRRICSYIYLSVFICLCLCLRLCLWSSVFFRLSVCFSRFPSLVFCTTSLLCLCGGLLSLPSATLHGIVFSMDDEERVCVARLEDRLPQRQHPGLPRELPLQGSNEI